MLAAGSPCQPKNDKATCASLQHANPFGIARDSGAPSPRTPSGRAMLGQLLINGIAIGAIYSLLAVGFVIIYNTTRMLHLAHGTVYTFGAYAY
jgi:hypothetical protein